MDCKKLEGVSITSGGYVSHHRTKTQVKESLRSDLQDLLNRHSAENESDTPDFVLAHFIMDCLAAFDTATVKRDAWMITPEKL